ncbi:MAG: helix-turn-helix transcriptional regulator [Bacteroidota bacterium]
MYSKPEQKSLIKLGSVIRKKRIELKLAQAQLAFELGTDGRHIRRIEKGEINISYITLLKISESFDISLEDLFKNIK